jgi:SPP1 gp7 family putative phage head morphogenesis protein
MAQQIAVRRQVIASSALKRRKNVKLPEQRFPKRAQIQYAAALQKYQRTVNDLIRELILDDLETLVPQRIDGDIRMDVEEDIVSRIMQQIRDRLTLETDLEPEINATGDEVSQWQQRELNAQLAVASGVSVAAARTPAVSVLSPLNVGTGEAGITAQLDEFLKSNIGLITKMTDQQLGEVETIVRNGRRRGSRVEVLRTQIADRMKVTKSRAYLIARDQVNKLNGELNQLRQESVGIEEYIWRTSQDDRVRQRHTELDGRTFRWDDPPPSGTNGEPGNPGEPINCRCYGEPKLDHLIPQ